MTAFFHNPLLFGENILNSLHIFGGQWLDFLMIGFTMAGDEVFYILLLPVLYWCFERKRAIKIGLVFLVSAAFNEAMKFVFQNPRPDPALLIEGIRGLANTYRPKNSPGFPSGHTQGAVAIWGAMIYYIRTKPLIILGLIFMVFVPYSRLYLGVHYFGDVMGGYLLGLISLLIMIPSIEVSERFVEKAHEIIIISLIIIVPVLFFLLVPGKKTNDIMGVLSGFLAGAYIGRNRIAFLPRNSILWNGVKIVIGLTVLYIIKEGMKLVLPLYPAAGFIRYWLVGIWCSAGAPLLFSKFQVLKGKE